MKFTAGEGATALTYEVHRQGPDLVVAVYGGEAHIGAVSLSLGQGLTTLTAPKHKDDFLTKPLAQALAQITPGRFLVYAGFHLDNITWPQIEAVLANHKKGVEKLVAYLSEPASL